MRSELPCTLCGVAVEDHGSSCGMVPAHKLVEPVRVLVYGKLVADPDCPHCEGRGDVDTGRRPGSNEITLVAHCICVTIKRLG